MKTNKCVARLYVLKGLGFQPMDVGGLSDPYLVVKVGKQTYNDLNPPAGCKKWGYITDSVEPDLYRSYEFDVTLPGTSQLTVTAYDYDNPFASDLIGSTTFDLENRLFDPRWQELGREHESGTVFRPLPLERRSLWVPSSKNPQGHNYFIE